MAKSLFYRTLFKIFAVNSLRFSLMSYPKQHLLPLVLPVHYHSISSDLLHFDPDSPLISVSTPCIPLHVPINHVFQLVHLYNHYDDCLAHRKPHRSSALIDPHGHLLLFFRTAAATIIWRVLVEVEVSEVEAPLEVVLAQLVAVGTDLHQRVKRTHQQVFT